MNRVYARLTAGYLVLIGVTFLLLGMYLITYFNAIEREDRREQLQSEATLIAQIAAERTTDSPDSEAANALLEDLSDRIDSRITVLNAQGDVLADTRLSFDSPAGMAEAPAIETALSGETAAARGENTLDGRDEYAVAVPIMEDGNVTGVVRTAIPAAALGGSSQNIILALVIAAGVVAFAATIVPRAVTRPLSDMVRVARRVSSGDLNARASTSSDDELSDLAVAINEMTDNLQGRIRETEDERARLAAILEHLTDGILILDRGGAVILVNRAAEKLLDIDRERALVRSYREVIRDHELVDLIRTSREVSSNDAAIPTRDIELGRPRRSIQAFAYPITQGEGELVVLVLRDVTELRRTETVRRDFVANVSHDLRTPVASIKALAETLRDGALEDEDVARDFLARMEVEIDDLARLVEELLQLSLAESRRVVLNTAPTDLGTIVERVTSRLQTQADPAGVTLSTQIPDDLPVAEVDPDRIEQVLVNLVQNAIKYTPAGGTVSVTVEAREQELLTSVTDQGPGLPTEELERVFERFYKADRSRSNTGSGLGLAIAKHLVQSHGGRIWAESDHRGGSTFRFSLPLVQEHAAI